MIHLITHTHLISWWQGSFVKHPMQCDIKRWAGNLEEAMLMPSDLAVTCLITVSQALKPHSPSALWWNVYMTQEFTAFAHFPFLLSGATNVDMGLA